MKKKLGILGGMGPFASKVFYERIINNTLANSDNEHIDIMLLSHASIPDRTSVILNGMSHEIITDIVKDDLKAFSSYGVENIAITCNTFHYFLSEVQALTSIPIINMLDIATYEASLYGKDVTVFGTSGTLNSKIYEPYIEKYGLNHLKVSDEISLELMDIIYGIKKSNDPKNKRFNDILDMYIKKGSVPLIACTELSTVVLDPSIDNLCVDALSILCRESILKSGYSLKYDSIKH